MGGIGPDVDHIVHMKRTADRLLGDAYQWSTLGAGRYQMGIATAAAIMGSHVRVGLEDSLYLGKGQLAESNADQVRKIRGILEALSLEIATPAEVPAAVDPRRSGEYPTVDPGRLAVVGHSLGGWAAILAAAADQRLRAVAVYGAAVDLGVIDLTPEQLDHEMTRFLAVTPDEFERQRADVGGRPGPLEVVASIAPRPLLIMHGRDDAWVPVEDARRLRSRAGRPCRYVEVDGANHSFAWHRAELRGLVTGWLDEVSSH